jgi:hypothetical protein
MFVDRSRLAQSAVLVGACAIGACSDPTLRTDLRPEGPPEVLSVLVMNDSTNGILEQATFCKTGDDKRPGVVGTPDGAAHQICDEDLSRGAGTEEDVFDPASGTHSIKFTAGGVQDAVPTSWYARIMFDELLNPDVEELTEVLDDKGIGTDTYEGHIKNTQPVVLTCGGAVIPYDGYYSPSGNSVTWPLGPSLFIAPIDPTSVATGAECTVAIKADVVRDKDGIGVPAEQLSGYKFSLAALQFTGSSPGAVADPTMPDQTDPAAPVVISFNAVIDSASLTPNELTLETVTTCDQATPGIAVVPVISDDVDGDVLSLDIADAAAPAMSSFVAGKIYRRTFKDTNEVADIAGGTGSIPGAADLTICFTPTP